MAYDSWVIGGVTPKWIIDVDPAPNLCNGQFTIHCMADGPFDLSGADPRTEIAQFEAMMVQTATNKPLLNGGTKLQIQNGDYITVTDGINTWTKAAIVDVKYTPDLMSQVRMFFDITIMIELSGPSGSTIYQPDYSDYPNIDYYFFYEAGPPAVKTRLSSLPPPYDSVVGTEIGYMEITETQNVTRVEVYGCGDVLPCYIECNGVRQYWHYGEDPGGINAPQNEKLTWDLETPTTTIILNSSDHAADGTPNKGCYLAYVRVIYE